MLVRLATQTSTVTNKCGWLNTVQNQGSQARLVPIKLLDKK